MSYIKTKDKIILTTENIALAPTALIERDQNYSVVLKDVKINGHTY
jgi:hypothetical protein